MIIRSDFIRNEVLREMVMCLKLIIRRTVYRTHRAALEVQDYFQSVFVEKYRQMKILQSCAEGHRTTMPPSPGGPGTSRTKRRCILEEGRNQYAGTLTATRGWQKMRMQLEW